MVKTSLTGKKIWFDIEEPKTGIMFNGLIKKFQEEGVELLITARDYDSTFQILDDLDMKYHKIGKHGGARLEDKLRAYIKRLEELLPHVMKFSPDFFVTFSSVEGTRIAYGLKIKSFGYNDEPRNEPVCRQILPLMDNILTPECVPKERYIHLGADPNKILRYNGIDEIAWLLDYVPNPQILEKFNLEKGGYVVIRSEPSFASYLIDKLKPEETLITQFFPKIYQEYPDHDYFLLVRTIEQEQYLQKTLSKYSSNKNVRIMRYLPNLTDLCFYSALVISGGGTIVRESSLLNVPSIEFFPGESAPQENFLIKNGFPLKHVKEVEKIITRSLEILAQQPTSDRFSLNFKNKIEKFENPNEICFNTIKRKLVD